MTDVYTDLRFAKLDLSRHQRTGNSETVFCAGKTKEQLAEIIKTFSDKKINVLGTRCSKEQAEHLQQLKLPINYDALSSTISICSKIPKKLGGIIAVCCAGTADLPVAVEAVKTAEFFGAEVQCFFDIGIAGIHRLFAKLDNIRKADVIIAIAGMEGALGSVVAGLVDAPVIAVPTSIGYGASFHGLAPLLTMLNSCAEGISVVNIDNGFGAAVTACKILRRIKRHD